MDGFEGGWICLYRKLLDSHLWQCTTASQKTILITILLSVNHAPKKWLWQGKEFECEAGQFITSLESLAQKCGKDITIQNVRTALKKFENLNFLTNESTKTGRLIIIVNWGLYQEKYKEPNKDTNKELTKNQQRLNKELTPNNNETIKQCNNETNNIYMSDSKEYRLASYLFRYMRKNNEKVKEPNFKSWCEGFDKILRIDKRDTEEVKEIIKFSQKHEFWHKNILSPTSLRKQYDQLVFEMKDNNPKPYNKKPNRRSFNDFEQRTYDFDDLEKKLLGWDD